MHIKKLISPMEMAKDLNRNIVQRWEMVLYSIFFALPLFISFDLRMFHTSMDDSLMFASSLGGNIFSIALAISIVPFFVIPAILAWRKMSMVVYVTYFISLNIPITIVTIGASGALEFFYVIINQTFNAPISFTHFLLSSAIVMAQSLAMSYYMHQAIRLQQHRK